MMFFNSSDQPAGGVIPSRHEVAPADTWDLTALYPDDAAWQAAFGELQQAWPAVTKYAGRVGESAATLLALLEEEKRLNLTIERLYHYAMLRVAEDASDAANLQREGLLQNLLTRISEATAFVAPEIQAIDDERFEAYLSTEELAPWRTALRKLRRLKAHTLSGPEERLLALGATAVRGHRDTFDQLTNVDMRFGTLKDENGQEKELSQSSFSSFLVKRDPALRKAAFHQFYHQFAGHQYTLASTLAHSVRSDVFRARARNYPSAREAALFSDDVPVSVYDNLIAAVRANLKPLYRYYELRRKVLGLKEIHHYDTYVPMVASIETHTPFDQASDLVLTALAPLGSEYTDTLATGLRNGRWCDRYENKGKRSGAFSSSSYGNPPYILMNYKEDVFSDIYTLAHEAGHSMHSWYSQREQTFQDYDYPIFLAEVASTFNEELLTHHLLEKTSDPKMRAYLLNRQIDDIRGTVYRQTMFAEFEKIIHELEEKGEALTLDLFRNVYRGLLEAYFGPDFTLDPALELECLRIPHFYSAFYVYKYATGMSAAVTLSQQVLASGETGPYLGFLKSGGSRFPLPTLAAAGVDMSQPAPVEATLQLFARRVNELEALLTE
ncbi:MAG TPA: oligoendopeptidase F [Chthoniobacteraceae bacterium]|nr:oligoendopeptidase F [Chthoniobacteraceae bacterium]